MYISTHKGCYKGQSCSTVSPSWQNSGVKERGAVNGSLGQSDTLPHVKY